MGKSMLDQGRVLEQQIMLSTLHYDRSHSTNQMGYITDFKYRALSRVFITNKRGVCKQREEPLILMKMIVNQV
eukprot:55566-Ditylum_brightwellii.AAC.2